MSVLGIAYWSFGMERWIIHHILGDQTYLDIVKLKEKKLVLNLPLVVLLSSCIQELVSNIGYLG